MTACEFIIIITINLVSTSKVQKFLERIYDLLTKHKFIILIDRIEDFENILLYPMLLIELKNLFA